MTATPPHDSRFIDAPARSSALWGDPQTDSGPPERRASLAYDPYPSRTGDGERSLPRLDPVVHGSRPDQLSAAQWNAYQRDGLLFVEDFLPPPQVKALSREIGRLRAELSARRASELVGEPSSNGIRSIFHAHEHSEEVLRLARSPQLLSIVEAVLGGPVYLHQSRVNYKAGFVGESFFWHSDFETWHTEDGMPRMRAVSCAFNLTDNTPHNGPLMLIPGSHRRFFACAGPTPARHYEQSLKRQERGVPSHDVLRALIAEHGIVAPVGGPGSLLMFDCNTMHGSSCNISPYPRSNVFLVFNSAYNRLREPSGGLPPRPEHLAARRDTPPLLPLHS